jgi:hypothetical protein
MKVLAFLLLGPAVESAAALAFPQVDDCATIYRKCPASS